MIFNETLEQRKTRLLKEKQDNAETLRFHLAKTSKHIGLLSPDLWYASGDNLHTIALILESYGYLNTASDAIRFFEKPWHFENDMGELASQLESEIKETL